jgi:hypothetical protein
MKARATLASVVAVLALTAAVVGIVASPASAANCGNGQGQALLLGCNYNKADDTTSLITNKAIMAMDIDSSGGLGLMVKGDTGVYAIGTTYALKGLGGAYGTYGTGYTYGVWGNSSYGAGVYGENIGPTGEGVYGKTGGNGSAVYGQATAAGTGVYGDATDGPGVLAHSTNGTALWVNGTAHFSQSGVAVVPSGAKSVVVSMSGVTTASMILATAQQVGGFYVKYAVPSSGSFTISLNKAPASPKTVRVAYIVLS